MCCRGNYKHYSEFRKLVDYSDGCLVVNPVKVGRHFYANRKDENAKSHRNAFLKYMHKISLAQELYRKLQAAQSESADGGLLPDVLATGLAMKYWGRCAAIPSSATSSFADWISCRRPRSILASIANCCEPSWRWGWASVCARCVFTIWTLLTASPSLKARPSM